MQFETSQEHYDFLLEQVRANGGPTEHTMETIPVWEGLWTPTLGPNIAILSTFVEGGGLFDGGEVRPGLLTPPYEKHLAEVRAASEELGGDPPYDRLTHCEPPGYPRFLLEPYVREFINMPNQSWQMNDLANEIRRIYINQEHQNLDGTHSWLGDSVGFWDEDRLIVHTVDVLPVDYFRGQPLTSNQLESVEIWERQDWDDGVERLVANVTFYDPHVLIKPITAAYTYERQPGAEEAGYRIRTWECETTSNSFETEDGMTNLVLPGEPGFKDARGFSAYPDLPGQSRDPIYGEQR